MISLQMLHGALLSSLQVGLASWFCLAHLTRRDDFVARSLVALAALVGLAVLDSLRGGALGAGPMAETLSRLAFFAAVLSACVALGVFLCKISVWTSIFCCAVGCTVQNLSSSLAQLVFRLAGPALGALDTGIGFTAFCDTVFLVVLLACNAWLFRGLEDLEHGIENDRRMLAVYAAVVVLAIGLSALLARTDELLGTSEPTAMLLRACHVVVCGFLLFVEWEIAVNRRLEEDMALSERLAHERERQMELSRETIDAINLKCHDMRHQIRTLARGGGVVDQGVIEDMEHQIRLYDSSVRTGNDALDTILTEKGLICERRGITLSCIADGAALDFMPIADVYSLFGNALDNAIEAVDGLEDRTKRVITLNVHVRRGLVAITIENYCDFVPRFEGGLPTSERSEGHGYGMRSMRLTAERWGGSLSATCEDGLFRLGAVIPLPQD